MPAVIVKLQVTDFAAWLPVYESRATARQAAGAQSSVVYQDEQDPNRVAIVLEVEDLDRAREFITSDETAQTLKRGGVVAPPEVQYLNGSRKYSS
jgi:hypothetical protein